MVTDGSPYVNARNKMKFIYLTSHTTGDEEAINVSNIVLFLKNDYSYPNISLTEISLSNGVYLFVKEPYETVKAMIEETI